MHRISLFLGALGWSSSALGQVLPREPLDVERFKPALTPDAFAVTEGTAVRDDLPDDPVELGAAVNGAFNELVVVSGNGIDSRFVSGRVGVDLFASATLFEPLALAVGMPFFFAQAGDFDPAPAGLGDLRLIPKLRLIDDRAAPIGLALLAEVRVPTHSDDEFSGGARSPVFAPKLALDHRFPFGFRLGINGGALLRQTTVFENVSAGSEVTYSVAASIHPGGYEGRFAIGADIHGGAGLSGLNFEELPLEGQLYALVLSQPNLLIQLGPAMGLIPGYGTPTFRFYAGIRYAPSAHDRDLDGISDREDDCPEEREIVNGVDDWDGCPDTRGLYIATVQALDPDGTPIRGIDIQLLGPDGEATDTKTGAANQLPPGKYAVTVEAPGYKPRQAVLIVSPDRDNTLVVELQPLPPPGTVTVTILGPDGEPLKKGQARVDDDKASGTGAPGVVTVEVPSGEHVLWVRAKGHVPQRVEIVVKPGAELEKTVQLQKIEISVTDERLEFAGTVYFATGSANLLDESSDLLDEVVLVLQDNASIKKLRVEGHTDARGDMAMNMKLSEARASSVVRYLVKHGIAPTRLESAGFGESRPISENYDENRRVEFVIIKGRVPGEPEETTQE